MSTQFTPQETAIISALQDDLELCERPFERIAQKLGLKEEDILDLIKKYMKDGRIRRFGATLYHRISGYEANAMVAWQVPEEDIERVGVLFANQRFISHCYVRVTSPEWPYNLYTMIHAKDREKCYQMAAQLSEKTGIKEYQVLFSNKELKKISMHYVDTHQED